MKNHKVTTGFVIFDFIFLILLLVLQGFEFILLSFIFWIFILVSFGLLLNIITNSMINRNLKKGKITLDRSEKNKKIIASCIVFSLVLIGILGFTCYSSVVPRIKAVLNDGYLQNVVTEITEGKTTDYEKISAVLEWFDPDRENLYNSYYLTHSEDPWYRFLDGYVIYTLKPPYICVRCYEDVDPRWLLTSRCGSCGEYSRLFMVMVDALGYDVKRVHAEGEDHVWNEIKIDDEWIPVDPTNVSLSDGGDGWEDYGFFEWKEGNLSYAWAEYLHNDTIEDRTSHYTNLTNVTIHCIDENNNSISNVTITIMSDNLDDTERIHETFIEDKSKPKTNETGFCTFQIGGGTYKFKGSNDNYSGETEWVAFSDQDPSHEFTIDLKRK